MVDINIPANTDKPNETRLSAPAPVAVQPAPVPAEQPAPVAAPAAKAFSNEETLVIADIEDDEDDREIIEKLEIELKSIEGRLNNEKFISSAPKDVVEKTKERKDELLSEIGLIQETIKKLS